MPRKTKKQKLEEMEAGAVNIAGSVGIAGSAGNFVDPAGSWGTSLAKKANKVDFGGAVNIGGQHNSDSDDYDDDNDDKFEPSNLKNRSAEHFWENIEEMTDPEFYHWVLNLNASEWEAIRESANQLIGGAASSMWARHKLKPENSKLRTSMHHYRDILMTPNKGAGARMLELDHDTKGAGFKTALKHAVRGAKNIVKKVNRAAPKIIASAAKGAQEVGKVASKVGKVASAVGTIPGLEEIGLPVAAAAESVSKVVKTANPLLDKARDLKDKKSLTSAVSKAAKKAVKDPNKVAKTISNIQDAYKTGGDKVGDRILSGIDAASKAVEKQEQPQTGTNQLPTPALQSDDNPGGGYKQSFMMDPRRCR